MGSHALLAVEDTGTYVAVCECGWRSEAGHLMAAAETKWRVHARWARIDDAHQRVRQRSEATARRAEDLVVLYERARGRHNEVHAARGAVRARLWDAITVPRHCTGSARLLGTARELAGLSVTELWGQYVALGGSASIGDFSAWLDDEQLIDSRDHDIVAVALNEHFAARGFGQPIDYWR